MHENGARRGSDRDSCCGISIGSTISNWSTMHQPSIRIHSNPSPRAVTQSFPPGCQILTAAPLNINDQPSTLLQEVTLSSLIPSPKTSHFLCCCKRRRRKSGCENSTGLPNTAGWRWLTFILTICALMRSQRRGNIRLSTTNRFWSM